MRQRLVTALVLIAFVLAALFSVSPWPVYALATAFLVTGGLELAALLKTGWVWPGILITLILPVAASYGVLNRVDGPFIAILAGVLFLVGIQSAVWQAGRETIRPIVALLASGWLTGPILGLLALHFHTLAGQTAFWRPGTPLLFAFLPLWAGDSAAIFAGRAFGKTPLWPAISPKKTWEGAAANLAAAVLVALVLAHNMNVPWTIGLLCGLACGVVGQYGDLFESFVKRKAGTKDSGWMLPGHGGILDRIDSLLFAAPFVALILLLLPRA